MTAPAKPLLAGSTDMLMSQDWLFSNTSNVSAAKDRGWFVSYTPFTSRLESLVGNVDMAVVGIGSVEIPVKLRRGRHGTIRIDEVLHAPAVVCNILGQGDFMNRYEVLTSFGDQLKGSIKTREGAVAAYFDKKKLLFCLKLSGPPVGPVTKPSLFTERSSQMYYINAQWPDSERTRWQDLKPYTNAEKAWLKHHYGDEFHFLLQHGLSIHKDEDREDGRVLARSLIASNSEDSDRDDDDDDDDDNDGDDDDANSFIDEMEADPMSHVADYKFSDKQLNWIKKHFMHSGNFMLSYGLKPFDDDDCDEGRMIVEGLMNEDD